MDRIGFGFGVGGWIKEASDDGGRENVAIKYSTTGGGTCYSADQQWVTTRANGGDLLSLAPALI